MTASLAGGGTELDEQFFAIVAEDPDLLRAEFDELIDASWGPPAQPSVPRSHPPAAAAPRPDAGHWPPPARRPARSPRHERSPPPA